MWYISVRSVNLSETQIIYPNRGLQKTQTCRLHFQTICGLKLCGLYSKLFFCSKLKLHMILLLRHGSNRSHQELCVFYSITVDYFPEYTTVIFCVVLQGFFFFFFYPPGSWWFPLISLGLGNQLQVKHKTGFRQVINQSEREIFRPCFSLIIVVCSISEKVRVMWKQWMKIWELAASIPQYSKGFWLIDAFSVNV